MTRTRFGWCKRELTIAVLSSAVVALGCGSDQNLPALATPSAPVAVTAAPADSEHPQAVIDESEHNFGVMELHGRGEHTFVIKNEGRAKLELSVGEVSCKCTSAELSQATVAPQETCEVKLRWKTEGEPTAFHQWTRIKTNDPDHREIALHIRGIVQNEIRFSPAELVFDELVPPDTTATVEGLMVSDKFEELSFEEVKVSDTRFKVTFEPLTEDQRAQHKVLGGYVVRVESPGDLRSGHFTESIDIKARVPGSNSVRSFTLPIQGRVRGRISVMGPKIDEFGRISLGALAYGQGAKLKFKVKVRDSLPELNLKDLQVKPAFLKVSLQPAKDASVSGMYDLFVEIPEETEPCVHRVRDAGKIHFDFDHPRVTKLDLEVDFSVQAPRDLP